ncbi:MAG: type III pantothenate kinase [Victivallaceae bacterium]|nr:type III pantothenate kinase [Victivallaceae bacterium]
MNVLNIGNTHSTLGIWEKERFTGIETVATAELTPALLKPGPTVAASVVPDATRRLAGCGVEFIDALHGAKTVDFGGVDAAALGADRVANAFAMRHFFGCGVAVDCGTAITFDIVDKSGRFYSGGIAPGRRLMRRALKDGTGLLPEIRMSDTAPLDFGADTVSNIRFGVDRGIIGMVKELLACVQKCVPSETVVFTGGDAAFFLPEFPGCSAAPENFTLYGILLAAGML